MDPIRVLIVRDEGPELSALVQKLQAQGAEVFTTGTGAGGLLLLGRVTPDLLVLDPTVGRARAEDWRRGIERYRSKRALALWIESRSESERGLFGADADL